MTEDQTPCETCDYFDACVERVATLIGNLDSIISSKGGLVIKFRFTTKPEDLHVDLPEGCFLLALPPTIRPYIFTTQIVRVANAICPEKYNKILERSYRS